jgi:hypothetical protein
MIVDFDVQISNVLHPPPGAPADANGILGITSNISSKNGTVSGKFFPRRIPSSRQSEPMSGSFPISVGIRRTGCRQGCETDRADPAPRKQFLCLVSEIYCDVEPLVVPIRVMIAAPAPVVVHAGNVSAYLRAMFAVLCRVSIDLCAISLKPPLAIRPSIARGGNGCRELKCDCQRRTKNYANDLVFHSLLSSTRIAWLEQMASPS